MRYSWCVLAFVVVACRHVGTKDEPPASTRTVPPTAAASPIPTSPTTAVASASAQPARLSCPERVTMMQKRLTAASERPAELGVDAGITVPRVDQIIGEEVPPAPVIAMSATGVTVDGQEVDDIVALLERKRALWRSFNPGVTNKSWPVLFTADAELELREVGALVKAVRQAGWTPWLMVQVPDHERVPRDPPPWVKELITALYTERWEPTEKASRLADAIARAVGTSCAPLAKAFAAVSANSVDPSDKGKLLAAELPKGVASCDCRVDVDALEALIVETLAGSDLRYRAVPLPANIADVGTVQDLVKR